MEIQMVAAGAAEVPVVRHEVAAHLTSLSVYSDVVDTAALLVSELLANAITHGQPPVRCAATVTTVDDSSVVRIEVWDGSPEPPILRDQVLDSESGRGLHLVEKLSSRWGWSATETGKCTWCELDTVR